MQARLRPDKAAIADLASGRTWTYAQLDEYVARSAAFLADRGTRIGDRVACLSRNRAEIVVLHLACARLGAIFVPLNWRLSPAELKYLLDDAEPRLLFGDEGAAEAGFDGEPIDGLAETVAGLPVDMACAADPDRPSLILYTSGTTGRPKGAVLSERNLTETAINFTILGSVGVGSTFLCDAPMFHVIGLVTNIRPPLLNGGTVLVSDGFVPERTLHRLMDAELGVTHYFCVPQMAQALRMEATFDASRLRHLTAIFTGGAPHPEARIREWLEDDIPIVDGFGMSEAGTVFGMPVDRSIIDRKAGSVGVPTFRVEARIANDARIETAADVAGELQLRGENLFRGYWGRDEDYRAAMTDDGWFRTGDIAIRDEDGYYRLVDRKKDMFISGGENVYPAEIEAVVCRLPEVAECAVVGVPDERWGEVGYLFVVSKPDAGIDSDAILDFLDSRIARYKRPKYVGFVDALPRNAAGKVLKPDLRSFAARNLDTEQE